MKKQFPIYKFYDKKNRTDEIRLDKKSEIMLNEFLEYCSVNSKGEKRTDNRRRVIIQLYDFLEKPFDKITYEDYVAVAKAISNADRTTQGRNELRAFIKRFLKFFYEDYEKRFKHFELFKQEKPEPRLTSNDLLTEKEIERLMKATSNMKQKTLITLLFESAGRPEEIMKLRWNDIDFKDNTISLFSAKTKQRRIIPLDKSIEHLSRLKEEIDVNDTDYIFSKKKPMTNSALTASLKELGKKAGIEKPIFAYLFRHTRLSFLITKLSPKIYENIAGHSLQMGMKTYAHLSKDKAIKEMQENVFEVKKLTPQQLEELSKLKEQVLALADLTSLLVKEKIDGKINYEEMASLGNTLLKSIGQEPNVKVCH